MAEIICSTPYTPIFPPAMPATPPSVSTSCDISIATNDGFPTKAPKLYIDGLKERYILLAGLPEELCPPSREASPEAEDRIEALRFRMRKARELQFPHIPELRLTSVVLRGGDWVGEPESDEEQGERHYLLPHTEQEWFEWEKTKQVARKRRRAERKASEHRAKIAKWSEEVEDITPAQSGETIGHSQDIRQAENGSGLLAFPAIKRGAVVSTKEKETTSRYFACQPARPRDSQREEQREDSVPMDPVQRLSSRMPASPILDPLPDFSELLSFPDSPSLPRVCDLPDPEDTPPIPSFNIKHMHTSTPLQRNRDPDSVLQLSSPISPPRSLRPLSDSQASASVPSRRPREEIQSEVISQDHWRNEPSTPRVTKKAHTITEPITPTSVPRPSASQDQDSIHHPKRLPTLTALLAASSKKASPRPVIQPRRVPISPPLPPSPLAQDFSPLQPSYSMFRPQFQSTQQRAWSLPPSPSQPMTSTQSFSPQKKLGGMGHPMSSGIGFYQSQFSVEGKIGEVADFLNADVWDIET